MMNVYSVSLHADSVEAMDKTGLDADKFKARKIIFNTLSKEKALDRYYKELAKKYGKPIYWMSKRMCDAYCAELRLDVYDLDKHDAQYGEITEPDECLESDSWYIY